MQLDIEYISIINNEVTWDESINLVAEPLISNQYITHGYINEIFESIKQLGFYIVISPQIALPHSRPSASVLKTGFSVLKSNKPIKFGSSDINLVVMFCSVDDSSHIAMLSTLCNKLCNEDDLNKILQAKTNIEIYNVLNQE